jgi:rubrerythrin
MTLAQDVSSLGMKHALEIGLAKEEKAEAAYLNIESRVQNFLLKEKARFLAGEEVKHHQMLETLFRAQFPHEKPEIPTELQKPWADPVIAPDAPVPDLLNAALVAEKASQDFYLALAENEKSRRTKAIYNYLAAMEQSHYYLVLSELELAKEVDGYWEMQEMSEGFLMTHMGT